MVAASMDLPVTPSQRSATQRGNHRDNAMTKCIQRAGILLPLVFAAGAALAQQDRTDPAPEPLSKSCIAEATRIFNQANAFHDGKHKTGIPVVVGEELARVQQHGELRGSIDGRSTLTPASGYALIVVQGASIPSKGDSCPLHRTYIRFIQGGFNPQPPKYYGPLRASAA